MRRNSALAAKPFRLAGRSPADLRSARSAWIYWGEAYPSASIRRNKGQGETASLDAADGFALRTMPNTPSFI